MNSGNVSPSSELGMEDPTSYSKKFFPPDFMPGTNDVIIGRGRKSHVNFGNERLKRIVASKLSDYSAAATKGSKSKILSAIVTQFSTEQPTGYFVKQDPEVGLWFAVDDLSAREKVSQAFRDALHENYRSSNEFKKRRRQEKSISTNSLKDYKKPKFYDNGKLTNFDWTNRDQSNPQSRRCSSTTMLQQQKSKLSDLLGNNETSFDFRNAEFQPKKRETVILQNGKEDLSQNIFMMLESSASKYLEPKEVSKISSSIPSSEFLVQWFEHDEIVDDDIFEPVPLKEMCTETTDYTTGFEDFVIKMDKHNEGIRSCEIVDSNPIIFRTSIMNV